MCNHPTKDVLTTFYKLGLVVTKFVKLGEVWFDLLQVGFILPVMRKEFAQVQLLIFILRDLDQYVFHPFARVHTMPLAGADQ